MASKYSNKKCEYTFQHQTYEFSSKLERDHAIFLFNELKRFRIENLILQPEFQLCGSTTLRTNSTKSGKTKQMQIKYIADFSYIKDGKKIVSDAKGVKTSVYSLKKKLFLSQLDKHEVDEFQEVYRAETVTYSISR